MHDYASLQFYDKNEDFYVLGMEDAKDNLGEINRRRLKLDGYYKFVENTVFGQIDSVSLVGSQKFETLGSQKGKAGDYFALSFYNDVMYELYYRVAVYESDSHFFQLVIWMPYENYCDKMATIDKITYSFQAL